jgi:hypothetical protein
VKYLYSGRRIGIGFGSLNGLAPKFHLTPTIEIDLFLGLTIRFHWLGVKAWVRPWYRKLEAERNRIAAERIAADAEQAVINKWTR